MLNACGAVHPRSNWILGVLVFVEGRKPENAEENPRSQDYGTRATFVGGERSHNCAISAPYFEIWVNKEFKKKVFP